MQNQISGMRNTMLQSLAKACKWNVWVYSKQSIADVADAFYNTSTTGFLIFIVVPCISIISVFLWPTNAQFINHVKC
jgi:hypothetical protein